MTGVMRHVKPILIDLPNQLDQSIRVQENRDNSGGQWHYHLGFQITTTLFSNSVRRIGDDLSPANSGEVVLLGAGLPHCWRPINLPPSPAHEIIASFDTSSIGQEFLGRSECSPIRQLLDRASRGLLFQNGLRERAMRIMEGFPAGDSHGRLFGLLAILHDAATHMSESSLIASPGWRNVIEAPDERLSRVFAYIRKRIAEEISRDEVAALACMTPNAFSRWFKARTAHSLPDFINELRIGNAARMLAETDKSVSEIAFACGFNYLSYFNRQFVRHHRRSSTEFRRCFSAWM